jgi:methyl-accepting chemotaxis protein
MLFSKTQPRSQKMKINLQSISTKLILGGVTVALLPLIIASWISYNKSHDALLELSMERAEGIAADLANMTQRMFAAEMDKASTMSGQKRILEIFEAVENFGTEANEAIIGDMFADLTRQFSKMDNHYQGLFLANSNGKLFTGILESGKEYKGSDISGRSYFKKAKQERKPVLSDIVISKSTGKPIAVVCVPMQASNGAFLGALGLVLKAEYFTKVISSRKIGETGYGYMINRNGVIFAHPKQELVLKLDVTTIDAMTSINQKMMAGETGAEEYRFKGVDKISGYAPVGINGWSIGATQNESEFLASSDAIRNANILVTLVAGLLTAIVVFLAARTIVKPINAAVAGLKDIARGEGDLTMRLEATSKDEVGELARWFNVFIEKLQGIMKDISGGVETLSSSTELSAISEQMTQGISNVSDKSTTVSAAAEEMNANMNNVAAAMEQSATNTNMVATSSEEMSATIDEIAKNAEKARGISDEAAHKASTASTNMDQLGNAANSIGKVVETITEISEQVNLLALNATIEAARAGEAGKGFAVVANEIKELAKQTAEASGDIKEKIEGIQGTTSTTVGQIAEITQVITDVNEVVATIATAVEEQSAATKEIASNVSQASRGIQEVNENVNQSSAVSGEISKDIAGVSTSMDEMSTSSSQVNLSAQELSKLSEELKQLVDQFKI